MRGALTGDTLFATVLLTRQATKELILVVEGDDDHYVFEAHINDRDVRLVMGTGGKPNVLRAAEIADAQDLKGVRFFVDADFDRAAETPVAYPANVTVSTNHDTLMDVVLGGDLLLDRVIDTHCRAARRAGNEFTTEEVRREAMELAGTMVPLRVANEDGGLGLRLRDFPLGNVTALPAQVAELAQIAIARSNTSLTIDEVVQRVGVTNAVLTNAREPLVGDHDFFRALSRVLRSKGVTAGAESLLTAFLAGMLCAHLGVTDWYVELTAWGAAHNRTTFACPCAA